MRSPGPVGGDLLARRYRLIDRVGAGGMSVVWRARDEVLDRLVAVKWLGAELADDELFRDLVRREAWATARIKHPAVAAVYDYGEVSNRDGQSLAYVVMEMLDGESLADRLQRGPLPWREAVSIGAEVADALATAHEQGVVHRDISPDNVMLTSSGLRVFDFGIAAPVGEPDDDSTGSTFGTPAYVAPERLDGQPAQTATDVYSLGVLMFEMITGRPPFPEDTWDPEAPARPRVPPRLRGPAGLPPAVARLSQRCVAHDPLQRPPAREVADRLAAYTHPWWRGRVAVAAAGAGVVTAATVVALVAWGPLAPTGSVAPPTHGAPAATAVPGQPVASLTGTSAASASAASSAPAGTGTTAPTVTVTVTTAPPVASVPVEQALDDLRSTITAAPLPTDLAQDLRQQLENSIAQPLAANPTADVRSALSAYRNKILQRANELDAGGQPRMTAQTRADLLAAVDRLSVALGYA